MKVEERPRPKKKKTKQDYEKKRNERTGREQKRKLKKIDKCKNQLNFDHFDESLDFKTWVSNFILAIKISTLFYL